MIALERAREMYREARSHHRAAQRERRTAERGMDEVRAFCARNGIAFEIVKTESVEGQGREQEIRAS